MSTRILWRPDGDACSPRKRALLLAAPSAGYHVTLSGSAVEITKRTPRTVTGIVLYENGTAFDVTVDLSVAKGIRSYAEMRKLLGLPRETR